VIKDSFGPRFLVQKRGIPQGSVLSTILCNFYYGNVETELLDGVFTEENQRDVNEESKTESEDRHSYPSHAHLLVRIVDDFLLVTTDRDTSMRFLSKMGVGIPHLGVQTNKTKTQTNYNRQSDERQDEAQYVKCDNQMAFFPWCGMLFDIKTCEVRVDYSRFSGKLVADSLTVDRVGKEGLCLNARMKSFVRPRCLPIFHDARLNGHETIKLNFYQAILFCAVKCICYMCGGMEGGVKRNSAFVYESIEDVILYSSNLINSRLRNVCEEKERHQHGESNIPLWLGMKEAMWLGRHAFCAVLKRKEECTDVVHMLNECFVCNTSEKMCISALEKTASAALRDFNLDSFDI